MSKITNDGLTRSGRHMMLYSCTHMTTVDVKWLTASASLWVPLDYYCRVNMTIFSRCIYIKCCL